MFSYTSVSFSPGVIKNGTNSNITNTYITIGVDSILGTDCLPVMIFALAGALPTIGHPPIFLNTHILMIDSIMAEAKKRPTPINIPVVTVKGFCIIYPPIVVV
jgi:hypothetical protein